MKRNVLSILLILVLPIGLFGQNLSPSLISAQGGYDKAREIILEWSVGESFVETSQPRGIVLTQGFHQPSSGTVEFEEASLTEFAVYPNPVQSILTIRLLKNIDQPYTGKLFDSRGSVITLFNVLPDNPTTEIDMTNLQSGVYLLNISATSGTGHGCYRIIKY